MAIVGRYTLIGGREDLTNKLVLNGDQSSTIFSNFQMDTDAKNFYHEWQTYTLASPSSANAAVDGFTPTATSNIRTRKGNYVQLMHQDYGVSDSTIEGLTVAGVQNELTYQSNVAFTQLHRDINCSLIYNSGSVTGDGSTAAKFCGMFVTATAGATSHGGIKTVKVPAATTSVFTETEWLGLLQGIFTQTGEVYSNLKCFASPVDVARIRDFTGVGSNGYGKTQFVTETTKVHNRVVTLVLTNFGNAAIIPDTMLAGVGSLAIFNMDFWALAWKVRPQLKSLGRMSDSTNAYWKAELTIENLKPAAQAVMTGIATS